MEEIFNTKFVKEYIGTMFGEAYSRGYEDGINAAAPFPENFTASMYSGDTTVELNWDKVDISIGYRISRDDVIVFESENNSVLSYIDTTPDDEVHSYKIQSIGDYEYYSDSAWSNAINGRSYIKLDTPTNVTSEQGDIGKILLEWEQDENSFGTIIKRDGLIIYNSSVLTSYTDSVNNVDTHSYEIISKGNGINYVDSVASYPVTNNAFLLLDPPVISVTTGEFEKAVTITWDSIANAESYEVYKDGELLGNTTVLFYTDNTGDNTTYSYTVKAVPGYTTKYQTSNLSNSVDGYGYVHLSTPTISVTSGIYIGKVVGSWDAIANAASYNVYNGSGSLIINTTATSYEYITSSTGDVSMYVVALTASDKYRDSANSNTDTGYARQYWTNITLKNSFTHPLDKGDSGEPTEPSENKRWYYDPHGWGGSTAYEDSSSTRDPSYNANTDYGSTFYAYTSSNYSEVGDYKVRRKSSGRYVAHTYI